MPRPRIAESMADAVAAIPDGSTIIIPGFGGAGFPWNLLTALYHQGTRDLTLVTNSLNIASANPEAKAITDMVTDGRVRKVIASFTASTHPSRASVPEQMARDGRLEVELVPQGTLAERIRSGGAGIPAFWTPAGVGTMLAEGKEHRDFEGETYILEDAIFAPSSSSAPVDTFVVVIDPAATASVGPKRGCGCSSAGSFGGGALLLGLGGLLLRRR